MHKWAKSTLIIVALFLIPIALAASTSDSTVQIHAQNASGDVTGSRDVTFRAYDAWTGGSQVYSTTTSVVFDDNGIGSMVLDNFNVEDQSHLSFSIQISGDSESGRINVTKTPFAGLANNATYTSGGNCNDITGCVSGAITTSGVTNGSLVITESQISDLTHTTDTTLSQEQVEDFAGAMVSGNTETLITVTYQDVDGTIDFVVTDTLSSFTNDAGFLTTSGVTNGSISISVSQLTDYSPVTNSSIAIALSQITDFIPVTNASIVITESQISDLSHTTDTNETTRVDNAAGFSCGAGQFVNSFASTLTPSCATPAGGGGGGGDKWITNSTVNAIEPNATFSQNVFLRGYLNATNITYINELYALGGSIGLGLTETSNSQTLMSNVEGINNFTISTQGTFFSMVSNPGPSNSYLMFSFNENQGQSTNINFYEGGTGHNRMWNSGSMRLGGSASELCSTLTSDVDCDTGGTGADLVVQDDGWFGGKLFTTDWSNVSITTSQISDYTPVVNGSIVITESQISDLQSYITTSGVTNESLSITISQVSDFIPVVNGSIVITESQISDLTHTTDHGALTGLADDDHTQYFESDGSDTPTGNWSMAGFNMTFGGGTIGWNGTCIYMQVAGQATYRC